MERRAFLPLLFAPVIYGAEPEHAVVRGHLFQTEGQPPTLVPPSGKPIALTGDEPTRGVLSDPRLKDFDLEAAGHFTAPGSFEIDPIHTRNLFVYQNGRRLAVTYWCDICYIRTYTPGTCWCCQEWTKLDLREPDAPDPKP